MDPVKKKERYGRLYRQLEVLLTATPDPGARMATIAAVLHHKMEYFFWTGFYLLKNSELVVGPYQGPLACLILEKNRGVCWTGINSRQTVVVPNVHEFPGHIACDTRAESEIVVPVFDPSGTVIGVMDVDSSTQRSFDETDAEWLEKIVSLIFQTETRIPGDPANTDRLW